MLNKEEIKKLIENKKIIEGYLNLEIQLTPNGFDLTLNKIFKFEESGNIDFSNSERRLPETKEIPPQKENKNDKYGWWKLNPGIYKIRPNEIINLPHNLIGIAFPRSSLLRIGAYTHTGVWDAGFGGKSEFVLVVQNSKGINIKENARITHIIFEEIETTKEGYQGIYKNDIEG